MQLLLVESNTDLQSTWLERLQAHDFKTVVVSDGIEANAASSHSRFAMALFGTILDDSSDHSALLSSVQSLRARGVWTLCLIDPNDQDAERQAFLNGFDDCLSNDYSEESLHAKIEHARYLAKLELRLAQAQKLESIGELAAGIAHEINTPIQYVGDNTRFVMQACAGLNSVFECCKELLVAFESDSDLSSNAIKLRNTMKLADVDYLIEEIPNAITQTLEGVDRVANFVRAMKEFAHPGSTEMTLTDLSNSINNTVMVARNEWKYIANMETIFDSSLPLVPCLPGELNQVLLNMVVNASHAIAESLGDSPLSKGTITMKTRLATPFAEIRISDTGSGIAPENLERIFTPFFTTKAAGKGTGQGLAIAHTVIVEKHGGTIRVESEVGVGTTFIIQIPLEVRRSQEPSASIIPISSLKSRL